MEFIFCAHYGKTPWTAQPVCLRGILTALFKEKYFSSCLKLKFLDLTNSKTENKATRTLFLTLCNRVSGNTENGKCQCPKYSVKNDINSV